VVPGQLGYLFSADKERKRLSRHVRKPGSGRMQKATRRPMQGRSRGLKARCFMHQADVRAGGSLDLPSQFLTPFLQWRPRYDPRHLPSSPQNARTLANRYMGHCTVYSRIMGGTRSEPGLLGFVRGHGEQIACELSTISSFMGVGQGASAA